MKAYTANATFISNIYTQEAGDTNWNEYQVVVTGGSNSLNIRSADTTSNNLSVLNETRVSSNDTILLSTDGSNVVSGVCGLVTTGTIKTQTSTPAIISARSSNASPLSALYTSAAYYTYGYKLKPDGKVFWGVKGDGTLLEFNIGTVGSMNTATTSGKTLSNCAGIDFSPDGKYLFRMNWTSNYTVERLTLGTPWDISTVVSGQTVSKAISSLPASSAYHSLRIQPDGLGFVVVFSSSANWYKCTMTTAWDISTASYSYSATIPNSAYNTEISPDGKTWYWVSYATTTSSTYVYAAVAGTAWDPRTLGTAITLTCSDGTYVYNNSSGYHMSPLINLDGTLTLLPAQIATGSGYLKHATFNVDIALSKNIDISAFGLSSAPTNAWLKMPTTSVATSKLSPTLSWTNQDLELDGNVNGYTTGIASTTTSAVVGFDGSSLLSTGDSVILNGTTTVTLTGVTETSNGLVKQDPSNAVDYIKYSNKSFQTNTGTSNFANAYENILAQQHMRISSNGSYLYVLGGNTSALGVGVYQYVLSTPWDVSTATYKNYINVTDNSYTTQSGFDINPDGSSFVVICGASSASSKIYQYKFAKAHDFDSTRTIVVKDGYLYTGLSSAGRIVRCRFNRTGTQLLIQSQQSASMWTWYHSVGTAYDITTISGTMTSTSGTPYTSDECFTPDGNTIIGLGSGWIDGYMFATTASVSNSWASVTYSSSTASNATYTNWPANSVTISTYLRSLDISADGTKLYVMAADGTIYQFNVRLKTLTKYALTFAAQGSAPTSVSLPASITTPTMTTSVVSGNIVQTSNTITTNARSIQFKLTNNPAFSEITKVQLNLRKSA
jgi:hypothetical protein